MVVDHKLKPCKLHIIYGNIQTVLVHIYRYILYMVYVRQAHVNCLFFVCSSGMFDVKAVYSLTKVTPSPSTAYSSVQTASGLYQQAVTPPLR